MNGHQDFLWVYLHGALIVAVKLLMPLRKQLGHYHTSLCTGLQVYLQWTDKCIVIVDKCSVQMVEQLLQAGHCIAVVSSDTGQLPGCTLLATCMLCVKLKLP